MIYAENILICIAVPLIIAVFFVKGSARKVITSFIIGMVLCLISAYIAGFFEYVYEMDAEEISIFVSPVIEEIIKFLPVMMLLVFFNAENDELKLTAVGIGAGFATFENACHIISTGAQNLVYILIRGFAAGVMHVVSIYAFSVALAALRRYKVATIPIIVGALSISMTFHATYNLFVSKPGVSSYIGYVLPVTAAITLAYLGRTDDKRDGSF